MVALSWVRHTVPRHLSKNGSGVPKDRAWRAGRKLSRFNNEERWAAHVLLEGLLQLGLVSEDDATGWRERFERAAAADAEPLHSYSATALASLQADADRRDAERVGMLTAPLVHPRPTCTFEQLLGVMRVDVRDQAESRLDFIELYSDGFAVTWTSDPDEPYDPSKPRHAPAAWRRVHATDDLGTFYFPSEAAATPAARCDEPDTRVLLRASSGCSSSIAPTVLAALRAAAGAELQMV